jgi:hypothetical protein
MDSLSDPHSGATLTLNGDHASPARRVKPRMHEHDVQGPALATEFRIALEALHVQRDATSGSAKRVLHNRATLLGLFLRELEAFHGITVDEEEL